MGLISNIANMRNTKYDCFECNGINKECPSYTPRNEKGFCIIKHAELEEEARERNNVPLRTDDDLVVMLKEELARKVD